MDFLGNDRKSKNKNNSKGFHAKVAKGAKFREGRQKQRRGWFRSYFPTHDQVLSWMGHPGGCGDVGEERESAKARGRFVRCAQNDSQKNKGKNNSRFPSGMTERTTKARARISRVARQ